MTVRYKFETMYAKLDETELKLQELKRRPVIYCKIHKYVPRNFALVVHYSKEVLTNENEYFSHIGEDCMNVLSFTLFLKFFWTKKENYRKILEKKYWSEKILGEKYYKVRDHCHYMRKYKETSHSICDLHYKENSFISLIAHNQCMIIIQCWEKLQESLKTEIYLRAA